MLRTSFADAAHDAIRADIKAAGGEGALGRLGAFLESQVASRSLTRQDGSSTDAVLSRIEDELNKNNIEGALSEAEALEGDAAAALEPWLQQARGLAEADDALDAVSAAALGTN